MSQNRYAGWSKDDLIKRVLELEGAGSKPALATRPPKKQKEMDFSKYSTRKIAIRFAYLGWNYNGLAVQADPAVRTVEGSILAALHKTKMIPSLDPSDCEFSRCGRTDTGVSAMRQVISLRVRSNLSLQDQLDPARDTDEIDYLKLLNSLLSNDIVAYEICLRPPPGFDARFSCQSRHYHYYFYAHGLDIAAMRDAAHRFVGVHDFRNFCKVDGSKQISNFTREILHSSISPLLGQNNMYYFDLKGTAFLWHQVRSMMSILLLVGQGVEKPTLVSDLLDVTANPLRPVYPMAADYPLVLYDCEFPPDIEWQSTSPRVKQQLTIDTFNMWHRRYVQGSLLNLLQETVQEKTQFSVLDLDPLPIRANLGDGFGKPTAHYKPVMSRERLASPAEVNEKYRLKTSTKR